MTDHADIDHTGLTGVGGSAGQELDYVQKTSDTNITATSEATANTIVTGASVTYDGAPVMLEYFCADVDGDGGTGFMIVTVYDGSTCVNGTLALAYPSGAAQRWPVIGKWRFTPSAGSHQYSIRAFVSGNTGHVRAGAAGTGATTPTFMRITKV